METDNQEKIEKLNILREKYKKEKQLNKANEDENEKLNDIIKKKETENIEKNKEKQIIFSDIGIINEEKKMILI